MKKYFSPTPVFWRKVGDSLLLLSAGVNGSIMGLPLPDHHKLWIMFGISLVGTFGKILTNFAGDAPTQP
jgi:hypothetical protein